MPVIKTEILSVEAKRSGTVAKKVNLRIDNNSSITIITLTADDEARVEFRYSATYAGMGTIGVEGRLTYKGDEAKDLYGKWTETGNMPDNLASEIHTSIMHTCLPVAVLLSREVRLPPPMPMPAIQFKGKQKKKARESSGIEVA